MKTWAAGRGAYLGTQEERPRRAGGRMTGRGDAREAGARGGDLRRGPARRDGWECHGLI
jgi:hypothetical protein